jgi:hypothetical protein
MIVDNELFTKSLIAKLPNWRYFFEILAKLGLKLPLSIFISNTYKRFFWTDFKWPMYLTLRNWARPFHMTAKFLTEHLDINPNYT